MKTFDVVSAVIEGKDAVIGDNYALDAEAVDILREYCDVVDVIMSDNDGNELTAEVCDDTNHISIAIELSDLTYETKYKSRSYIDLMERAIKIKFSSVNAERVRMTLVFPSVWKQR